MKTKIIFWILFILWVISVFFYENIDLYKQNNLNKAWISQYWSGNHLISELIFSWAQLKQSDAILEYNKANSLYKQWENANNMQDKVDYFQKALDWYSWSIALEYNQDTQDNITFVEDILEKLSTPEEQKESEEKWENQENNSWEDSEKKEWESNTENESWESQDQKSDEANKWENDENSTEWEESEDQSGNKKEWEDSEKSSWEEKDEENNELTEEQKEQIEKYSDQLKKSEFYNQKYFNKKPQEINRDINDLMRDPFLEDWFVRWWEKDW